MGAIYSALALTVYMVVTTLLVEACEYKTVSYTHVLTFVLEFIV